jgi:hypothetical protein
MRLFVVLMGCLLSGLGAPAPAQADSGAGAVVVELFTSQGCSSCPPADALLGEISALPHVTALSFHVDYWDGLGWRDRFAIPLAAQRQRRYVDTLGLSSAFTPQIVIDGRDSYVGSDRRRILAAIARPRNAVPILVEIAQDQLSVTVPEAVTEEPGHGDVEVDVEVAAYLPQASTRVGGGENSGRALGEFNIVRQFRTLGVWTGRRAVFHAPLGSFPADATRAAVLLQDAHQGAMAGSAVIDLR